MTELNGDPPDGLACAVLSLRCEPGLARAVRSLLTQSEPVEVVVVNSGGGDAAGVLRAAGIDVPVVERAEPVYPGAARNLGIDATEARWIAFLAADCYAEQGWAAGRLREHRAGAEAVASMITNPDPQDNVAAATFLLDYGFRTIVSRRRRWAAYGLSYDRALFERHGRFREDMRTGEDTELNDRLKPLLPAWAQDVRTAHPSPTTVAGLVRDQWARARRRGAYHAAHTTKPRVRIVTGGIWTLGHSLLAFEPSLPGRGRPSRRPRR